MIRADLAGGGVRYFGCERAWIGSDLRMHFGPINPRDEVLRAWEHSEAPPPIAAPVLTLAPEVPRPISDFVC